MPKTTLTLTSTDSKNIDDQELAYHQSDADKLALIKEYVTIQ